MTCLRRVGEARAVGVDLVLLGLHRRPARGDAGLEHVPDARYELLGLGVVRRALGEDALRLRRVAGVHDRERQRGARGVLGVDDGVVLVGVLDLEHVLRGGRATGRVDDLHGALHEAVRVDLLELAAVHGDVARAERAERGLRLRRGRRRGWRSRWRPARDRRSR